MEKSQLHILYHSRRRSVRIAAGAIISFLRKRNFKLNFKLFNYYVIKEFEIAEKVT